MRAVTHTKACAIAGMRDRRIVTATKRRASQTLNKFTGAASSCCVVEIDDLLAKMRAVGVGRRLLSSKFSAPIYQFDSFARRPFAGNPAAVVPLGGGRPTTRDAASIAAENNLSETAFIVPAEAGADANYALRWFTPTVEVDMCGHATLASAALVLQRLQPSWAEVSFSTRSGILSVRRAADDAARST